MRRALPFLVALVLAVGAPAIPAAAQAPAQAAERRGATEFARLVERLSEPGGYFDTDNLISNESSYLHVVGAMRRLGVSGGAYIGVGPDQSFSYIASTRPAIAFIVDLRRDNMLQHLLFKALFASSRNRVEYLAQLVGRAPPRDPAGWDRRGIEQIVEHVDATPADRATFEATRRRILERVRRFGIPLTARDIETIGRFHEEFFDAGLDLRFTSFNRGPRPYYPTLRQLVLERDLDGRHASYLADEEDFQYVKSLQARNLVVPVVGNLAGDHALRAVGREVAARGLAVSALYTSNVEFYLFQDGSFERFAANVRTLPRSPRSVIIRSYFGGRLGVGHPQNVSGYFSTQLLQTIDAFVDEFARGGYRSYWDVTSRRLIDTRTGAATGAR
jgi:hypothetical protein